MTDADHDMALLNRAIASGNLDAKTREAFERMLENLEAGLRMSLSRKQRAWVLETLGEPQYENLVSRGLVPRGREVDTPAVLKHRPLKPPGRT